MNRSIGSRHAIALVLGSLLVTCAHTQGTRATLPRELGAQPVELQSASGSTIRGWFARGRPGAGAVLLLHGIGASVVDMLGRARFLHAAGFSLLLIDFRGHGGSSAARPTYGGLESLDAHAALEFLHAALPHERIGAIGISMGGAAVLLGRAPLAVDALVLESVYPSIDAAVRHRTRAWLGPFGPLFARIAMRLMFPRDGVSAADLRPIDRIGEQTAPLLVLAGTADRYTPPGESKALFERARSPKAFWAVEGAAHVDLYGFAPAEYERRVGEFLEQYLRGGADPSRETLTKR